MDPTCFLVDNRTRLFLPNTAWSNAVIVSLLKQGHEVRVMHGIVDSRAEPEVERAQDLLTKAAIPML